jgi:hypothetical protein
MYLLLFVFGMVTIDGEFWCPKHIHYTLFELGYGTNPPLGTLYDKVNFVCAFGSVVFL